MFEDFVFPDGTEMQWDSVNWLQKRFMNWLNDERRRSILTFPVETVNLLDDGNEFLDKEWADFTAEMWAKGHSFFLYHSDSVDSLASCCRLRNEIVENTFSYTLGAGGISTGSKCVMTVNLNRLVQSVIPKDYETSMAWQEIIDRIVTAVAETVSNVHKYLKAFNTILDDRRKADLLPLYDAGFVDPDKCYLTVGINGGVEAAEYLGCRITPRDGRYNSFMNTVLKTIHDLNIADREQGRMFNTEFVPGHFCGHVKLSLIDLDIFMRQQGASVMAA